MIGEKWRGYYLTAYGIAVKHGYKGTEEEWLESLVGPEGKRLELDVVDGNLMYRHVGDEEYKLLLSVEDFRGEEIDLLVSELSSAKADAIASAADASASEKQAKNYAENASTSETNAQTAAQSAEKSAQSAETNAQNTKQYALETKGYADSASLSKANAQISAQSAETNAQTAERYASEAKTARDEAVEIAGFDPTNYVQKTDIATIGSSAGLVKLPEDTSRGLYVTPSGELRVYGGTDGAVRGTSRYSPICADQLPYAVKVGLLKCSGMNSIDTGNALNNAQKTAIANWLGNARIETGEYIGAGIDDNGQTEISFAVGFSPSIVVINKISDNEDICTAILFKSMASKGIYSVFSNSQISQITADSIYFATDDTDMNFRITDNGGDVTFCMGGASYSYVVIG